MKRTHLSALLATVAVATVASLAYAQVNKLPGPKPPGVKRAPPGVTLKSMDVQVKCDEAAAIKVTLAYSQIIKPSQVALWGSIGNQTVDIPVGSGEKTVTYKGLTLNCSTGSDGNLRAALLDPWVVLGDHYMMSPAFSGTFTANTTKVNIMPE